MAVKREDKESPLRTKVSGEKFFAFAMIRMRNMAPREKRNAIEETA